VCKRCSSKTTTGRNLLHLIEPSEGTVKYEDQRLNGLSKAQMRKRRKDMQMVFQDPYASLNPRHTVGKIIEEPLKVHGMKDPEERKKKVRELLDTVGLSS